MDITHKNFSKIFIRSQGLTLKHLILNGIQRTISLTNSIITLGEYKKQLMEEEIYINASQDRTYFANVWHKLIQDHKNHKISRSQQCVIVNIKANKTLNSLNKRMAWEAQSATVFYSGEIIFRLLYSLLNPTVSERDFSMLVSNPSFATDKFNPPILFIHKSCKLKASGQNHYQMATQI